MHVIRQSPLLIKIVIPSRSQQKTLKTGVRSASFHIFVSCSNYYDSTAHSSVIFIARESPFHSKITRPFFVMNIKSASLQSAGSRTVHRHERSWHAWQVQLFDLLIIFST